jgi:CheY-like chemotaxis protein
MLSSKRILLLEDDRIDVMTIKRALKQLNISNELVVRENGEEGIQYLGEIEDLPGNHFAGY